MKFCTKCDNMYYMKIGESNELTYYCRNCEHVESQIDNKNLKVYSFNETINHKQMVINEYTHFDPTLPHLSSIRCPNPNGECPTSKDNGIQQDVIYIRYDEQNMKFMYMCSHCKYCWEP